MTTPQHPQQPAQTGRRTVVTGAAAAGIAVTATAASGSPAQAGTGGSTTRKVSLTVLGTTDLHGNVYNWDYFKNAEFDDSAHNDIGVAKVKTVIDRERAKAPGPVLVLDAGDTIQGTPLAYYYAKVQPIGGDVIHPMARAMNLIGYDAAALGNHEFNYGIPLLRTFESQLNFPLLGANAVDPVTKRPVFPPYVIKRVKVDRGPDLTVGILGLTNPGIAIWDKANVEGKMEFPGLVEQAKKFVPELKAMGCDVVVVSAHSGATTSSSYGDALPFPENAATLVAEEVADIDAILVGHAHVEIASKPVTNKVRARRSSSASRCSGASGSRSSRWTSSARAAGGHARRSPPRCCPPTPSRPIPGSPQRSRSSTTRWSPTSTPSSAPRRWRCRRPAPSSRTCRSSTSSTTSRRSRSRRR